MSVFASTVPPQADFSKAVEVRRAVMASLRGAEPLINPLEQVTTVDDLKNQIGDEAISFADLKKINERIHIMALARDMSWAVMPSKQIREFCLQCTVTAPHNIMAIGIATQKKTNS